MSRANGWYFVRIDDEWRPAEWFDGDWDLSPMMALLILEVDEDPISIAIHAENRQLRDKLAELEAQAAIGRRAVEIVCQALPVWDGDGIDPERHHCELTLLNERHRARAEIFSRLRDAEQAEPHSDDLAVDRFAAAMKAKLAAARAKGRGGWDDPEQCSVEFLAKLLIGHVRKGNAGNFEDIANLAMMLHQRGAYPAVLERAAPEPTTVAVEWPIADAEEQRLGWKLSYNFLLQIEKAVSKEGYTSSQEAVELTLLTAYAILRDAQSNNDQAIGGLWQPASSDDGMRNMDASDVCGGQTDCEPATAAVDAVALADSQLLDDLETVAREYMTGFSVVYRHACDGEPAGFVAMRRRHRTGPAPTLREAARRLLAGGE